MNEITLNNVVLPVVSSCDYLAAQQPFLHADRITDFHVMIYVTDGCIPVTEDGVDYEIHAGDLFFLKNRIRHFGKTEVMRGTRWYYVHFYLDELSLSEKAGSGKTDRPKPLSMILPKMLRDLSDSHLEQQIAAFTEYFNSGEPADIWNSNRRFFQLLTEIARYSRKEKVPLTLSDRISGYLARHYNQPFSARVLEQQFFLSYKHMASVFKKEKKMTMQQYHTNIRMDHACRLLCSTLLSVSEISQKVGYSDMMYFSRRFHAVMGMSPTEYRKLPYIY